MITAHIEGRRRDMLLLLVMVFGLLAAVPGVRQASNAATTYTQGAYPLLIFALAYFFVTLTNGKLNSQATALAIGILVIGLVSTVLSTAPFVVKTFLQTVLIPLLIFVALQDVGGGNLLSLWTMLRRVLFLASSIGVAYYAYHAGINILSLEFVFAHHYDQDFQALVGDHLYGNPNNASVVYLTSLGLGLHHLRNVKTGKRLATAAVLIELLAVVMTGSTGAVLSAVMLGLVAILRKVHNSTALLRLYATLLTVGFGIAAWRVGYENLGSMHGTGARLDARLIGIQAIFNNFWIGTGPGSSGWVVDQQLSTAIGVNLTGSYASAHDMFLNWGLDFGVPSMILFVLAVTVAASRILRSGNWTLILPLLGFVLGAQSSGISIVVPSNPAWALLLWVLLGLGWATSRRRAAFDDVVLKP